MDKKYYLDKLFICNFKPFEYIDSKEKPYYEIDFTNASSEETSIIFSGPNGYGKTSIFQAIEFALMGMTNGGSYKDRIRGIEEHIIINNLAKPCFIALQLKISRDQIITIVRYAEQGEVGKTVDAQREAKDFCTYILNEKFSLDKFLKQRNSIEIATEEQIAQKLGERNIREWLKRNYISQEQEHSFIMQKDADRVNILKSFIDAESNTYFRRFTEEKQVVEDKCEKLKEKIKDLVGKVKEKVEDIKGEEPDCGKVFEQIDYIWDRKQYQESEPFAEYIQKAKRTEKYIKNIELYKNHRCKELIRSIYYKREYLNEYVLLMFEPSSILEYKTSFERRMYLNSLIENDEKFLNNSLNKSYLTDEIVERIETLRGKKKIYQGMLDEKQKVYKKLEELHQSIKGKELIVAEVFDERCPFCGSTFKKKEETLATAIMATAKVVHNMQNVLDTSLDEMRKTLLDEQKAIRKVLEIEGEKEKSDVNIYKAIQNIEKNNQNAVLLRNEIEELFKICENFKDIHVEKYINTKNFNACFQNVEELQKIVEELKVILGKVKLNEYLDESVFDMQVYHENKDYTVILQNKMSSLDKLEKKVMQLEWKLLKQEAGEYFKSKTEYDKLLTQYRALCEKEIKLNKILNCQNSARKKYMENVAKYLEIPLYIYSGKLMQTTQNDLGVTCFTGNKKEELTQFKMTSGQSGGKKELDITEKFSAGQKAVTNIAMILALKKIAVTNLNVFMIDDPCQSLDELNIASFVEIMKNEFKDTQLILSTHEDKIAAYIKYKFDKANKNMRMFDVQKQFYSGGDD